MLTIKKNTYYSELYAYLLLKDNLLINRDVTIGDDIPNGLPDIYSDDKQVGVEVACIEEKHVFDLINIMHKSPHIKEGSFDTINMKFVDKKLKMAKPPQANFSLKSRAEKARRRSTKEGIVKALEYVIEKKLERLNNRTSYSTCKNKFLFLVSDHITKDKVNIGDYHSVYNKICKKYSQKFHGLFVALNDKLYFIDRLDRIHIVMKPNEVKNVRLTSRVKHLEQPLRKENEIEMGM